MAEKQVAVVAGGSGGIGEGVVHALLKAEYRVYVPTRQGDRSERLKAYVGEDADLITMPGDLCDEQAVAALRDAVVAAEGHIDAVVVSVGADYYGYRLHRMPRTDLDRSIHDNLITHFNIQRSFIEQLRAQNYGVYITLIGPEAENIRADAGMVSIVAAAQKMMSRVIASEASDSKIRIHALTAHTTVQTRSRGSNSNEDWITAEELGEYAVRLIQDQIPGAQETLHELRGLAQVRQALGR
ncbi:MAG: SDR family NAD(P)-dependent oxidoreductase [Spirochaetia bacterium]